MATTRKRHKEATPNAVDLGAVPAQKFYYHGTKALAAWTILTGGFKLVSGSHGRARGRGIYLSESPMGAVRWGELVVVCKLQKGTRILWLNGKYDQKTICSLRREFGHELLSLQSWFAKALPKNKHLTKVELVHLCNYIEHHRSCG